MLKKHIARIKTNLDRFPPDIKIFLLRAFIFFISWKGLYLFLWQTPRTIDDPLTQMVGKHSAWMLNLLNNTDGFYEKRVMTSIMIEGERIEKPISQIYLGDRKVVGIADGCNGLELFVLYLGFILAMPASIMRKAFFSVGGLLIIYLANILRCVGLAELLLHIDQYFEIAHHYIFKMVIYATIFFLWVWFSKKITLLNPAHDIV